MLRDEDPPSIARLARTRFGVRESVDEAMQYCPFVLGTSQVAPGIWAVQLQGSLDASNLSQLRAVIADLFGRGLYRLVFDLEKVTYLASAGFSIFLAALDLARKNGGQIVFSAPTLEVREVFHLLGLSYILNLAKDMESAITSISQASAS